MKIGIIGVGAIGGVIARRLAEVGHEVRVANSRGAQAVAEFADEIGAVPTDVNGAVADADVVVLSVPYEAISKLPTRLFDSLPAHATIIDTANYYPAIRDPNIAEIDAGKSESVWLSEQIGRPVTKAFNMLFSETLRLAGVPKGTPSRLAIAVAGDNAEQKIITMQLVEEMGFDAVDAGSLEGSWRQQPGAPSYSSDLDADQLRAALSAAVKEVPQKNRDYFVAHLATFLGGVPTRERMASVQRFINNPSWPVPD